MSPIIEILSECTSTSAVLASRTDAPTGTVVAAHTQSAGRGQRGNTWESEPGANLTFSILLRPESIPAARQFELSMLVALAVARTVRSELADTPHASEVTVKWPNDIYVGNRKIAGILIENALCGPCIGHSIAGVGLNVNQTVFLSEAPNPVSLANIDGRRRQLSPLLYRLCHEILHAVENYNAADGQAAALRDEYLSLMWRRDGVHPFREPGGDIFEAAIETVLPDGRLCLSNGKAYAFKEIIAVL